MSERALGLIAGEGRLPILVAEGMKRAGARVCCVGLRGHFDPALPGACDRFEAAGVYRIGRWIRVLRREGVAEAVLAGRVGKAGMHDPLRLFRHIPDRRAVWLWYRRLRRDRRNRAVLAAIADELGRGGIRLVDGTWCIPHCLADEGVLACPEPAARHRKDIARGWPAALRVAGLGIGQSIAAGGGRVLAVESLEGTDALIERAGRLGGGAPWVLLKVAGPAHDMRADVPTVGTETVERLARAGGACLVLEARRVIMIDKAELLAAAEREGIGVVGIAAEPAGGTGPWPRQVTTGGAADSMSAGSRPRTCP